MSYGYEPPKQDKPGSWSEVFIITRVAFGLLLPFFGALIGIVLLITAVIVLYSIYPALALLPLIVIGAVAAWALRRERHAHDAEVARIRGD